MTTETKDTAAATGQTSAWSSFVSSATPDEFAASWLAVLCQGTRGCGAGLLLFRHEGGGFVPAARWNSDGTWDGLPNEEDAEDPVMKRLVAACEEAGSSGRPTLKTAPEGGRTAALPVLVAQSVQAIAVLDVAAGSGNTALRALHWGSGWLASLIETRLAEEDRTALNEARASLRVMAALQDGDGMETALRAFVNEVHDDLGADRVSIALLKGQRLRLQAISQAAHVDVKSNEARTLVQAMEEARVQLHGVRYPTEPEDGGVEVIAAHQIHAGRSGASGIVSSPILSRGNLIGVLTAERMTDREAEGRFTSQERHRIDAMAAFAAPMIEMTQREARLVSGAGRRTAGKFLTAAFGPKRPGLKILLVCLATLLWIITTTQTVLHVHAPATIRGAVERAVIAPFDGYIAETVKRAGDPVASGDVMAILDDRDLRIELLRGESERAGLIQRQRSAFAEGNQAEVARLTAEIDRVDADIRLTRVRLDRIEVKAPLDGIVIAGDLSDQLGAPVTRGDVLFEVASGADLVVSLMVDEVDLSLVSAGATGRLAIAGYAAETLNFTVDRVAEVSRPEANQNAFEVQATLERGLQGLRPGLTGVAKIEAGKASILYTWCRPLVERARLLIWRWTP